MSDPTYQIRVARPDEVALLGAIEDAAGELFDATEFGASLPDGTCPTAILAAAQREGMLWVAEAPSGAVVGFACARWVAGEPHLEELDVHPDHGRRGLGAALIGALVTWARARGARGVTLSTFRDVPWNAPFYAKQGFRALDLATLHEELRNVRARESEHGLPIEHRVLMRLALGEEKGDGPRRGRAEEFGDTPLSSVSLQPIARPFEDCPLSPLAPVALRPATRDDVEFLFTTLRAAIGSYVEATWGGWDDAYQRELFVGTIDLATHQVIEVEGRAVGCLSVEEFIDRVALNRIFLMPEAQRRGVGTALVCAVRDRAHARGLPLVLTVQRVNPARALYERLGFAVVSETSTHYGMEAAPPEQPTQ